MNCSPRKDGTKNENQSPKIDSTSNGKVKYKKQTHYLLEFKKMQHKISINKIKEKEKS